MLQVFLTSVASVGAGLLCGGTAVLMGTHIIRPMMHFTQCSQTRDQCHCFSPFNRRQLSLDYSQEGDLPFFDLLFYERYGYG